MNCLYFIRKSDRSFHSVLSNYSRLISGQIARILTHSHRGLIQCQFLSSHKLGKHLDSSPHLPFLLGLPGLIRTPPFWGDYQSRCGLSNSTRLLQQAVNSTRLRAVNSTRLRAVNSTRLRAVNSTRLRAVNSTRLRAVNLTRLRAVNSTRLRAVNSTRLRAVNSTRLRAVNSTRLRAVNSTRLRAVNSTRLRAVNSTRLRAVNSTRLRAVNSTRLRAVNSTRLRAVNSTLQPWFVALCLFGEFNKQSKPELVSEQPRKLCNVAQYELKMATKHVEIASEDAVPSASAEFCTDVFDTLAL